MWVVKKMAFTLILGVIFPSNGLSFYFSPMTIRILFIWDAKVHNMIQSISKKRPIIQSFCKLPENSSQFVNCLSESVNLQNH